MKRLRRMLPLFIVTLLALGLRIYMLLGSMNPIEADQSMVGIMAMHILQGERPIFFCGQSYLGKRLFSEEVGLYSALYAAFPPFMLMFRGLMADADYTMLLIAGSLSLLLLHTWLENPSINKLLGLFVCTALGFWFYPVMGYYVLAMLVAWLVGKMKSTRPVKQKDAEKSSVFLPTNLIGTSSSTTWGYLEITNLAALFNANLKCHSSRGLCFV